MSTVTFEWVPDPQVFANKFYTVGDALHNTRAVPLEAASEQMQTAIRDRFDTETDPHGVRWQDWSESYAPIAEKFSEIGMILQWTGELADVASSSEAMIVTNDTLFYKTEQLPQYGLAHDQGMADRGTKGGELPQREFLGMDDQSAIRIMGFFMEWFDRSIDLYVTSTGRVAPRHRIRGGGPGGTQFAPRSSVGKGPLPSF